MVIFTAMIAMLFKWGITLTVSAVGDFEKRMYHNINNLNMKDETTQTTDAPMDDDRVLCGVILREIKSVIVADMEEQYDNNQMYDWDGTVSFEGIKRLIYGLWNEGKNELNQDMIRWMSPKAKELYSELIEKYKYKTKLVVIL